MHRLLGEEHGARPPCSAAPTATRKPTVACLGSSRMNVAPAPVLDLGGHGLGDVGPDLPLDGHSGRSGPAVIPAVVSRSPSSTTRAPPNRDTMAPPWPGVPAGRRP